jgi:hypothetical protein
LIFKVSGCSKNHTKEFQIVKSIKFVRGVDLTTVNNFQNL